MAYVNPSIQKNSASYADMLTFSTQKQDNGTKIINSLHPPILHTFTIIRVCGSVSNGIAGLICTSKSSPTLSAVIQIIPAILTN